MRDDWRADTDYTKELYHAIEFFLFHEQDVADVHAIALCLARFIESKGTNDASHTHPHPHRRREHFCGNNPSRDANRAALRVRGIPRKSFLRALGLLHGGENSRVCRATGRAERKGAAYGVN